MADFFYKTRGNSSPQGKPRVYFAAHPDDFYLLDLVCADIFQHTNCAIYYNSNPAEEFDKIEHFARLREMNLFVIPITYRLLSEENPALDIEVEFAKKEHIPILPLMYENGLDELFNEKIGNLQYLDKHTEDSTAITYSEKLNKFLSSVLIGDELSKRIREAFDAYIFLSYRKKDRNYAQELMRLIHKNDFCRDIAIWYDEFLTPGEDFNDTIASALEKSWLFALAVTPNLINETNYVMTTEYPMAKKACKQILPAEIVPTDHKEMNKAYLDIPKIIDAHNDAMLSEALLNALSSIALRSNDSDPEHNFFIGLAYLSGIDVERNTELALSMITSAAEAELPEAMKKLASMYQNGEGVERDFEKSIHWQWRLINYYQMRYTENESENDATQILMQSVTLAEFYDRLMRYDDSENLYKSMLLLIQSFSKYNWSWLPKTKLVCCNMLGRYAELRGNIDTARYYYESALMISSDPKNEISLREKGWVSTSLGGLMYIAEDYKSAQQYYEDALEFFNENDLIENSEQTKSDLSLALTHLGNIAETLHNYEKALTYHKKALEISKNVATESYNPSAYRDTAIAYKNIADIYVLMHRLEDALNAMIESFAIRKTLSEQIGTSLDLHDLALGYNTMGEILEKLGKINSAVEHYENALLINNDLYKISPTTDNLHSLTISYNNLGKISQAAGMYDTAEIYYTKSLELRKHHGAKTPEAQYDIACSCNRLGDLLANIGKVHEAIGYYEEALQINTSLYEKSSSPQALENCFNSNSFLGRAYDKLNDNENCDKYFTKACEIAELLSEKYPSNQTTRLLSISYNQLGRAKEKLSELETALYYHKKSMELKPSTVQSTNFEQLNDVANGHISLARVYMALKQKDEAISNAHEAVIAYKYIQESLNTANAYRDLVYAYTILADVYGNAGKIEDTIATLEESLPFAEWSIKNDSFEYSHYAIESILDRLSDAYGIVKNTTKQMEILERLLAIRQALAKHFETHEHHNDVAKIYSKLGYAARTLGDIKKALEYFIEALTIRENIPKEAYTIEIIDDLAHSYFDMGSILVSLKSKEAKPFLERALSLVEFLITLDPNDTFYERLSSSIQMMLRFFPE